MSKTFGAWLAARRAVVGLSQSGLKQLFNERGFDPSVPAISQWENDHSRPKKAHMDELWSILKVPTTVRCAVILAMHGEGDFPLVDCEGEDVAVAS